MNKFMEMKKEKRSTAKLQGFEIDQNRLYIIALTIHLGN